MDEAEIIRRVPVWTALAELFLDTELQDYDLKYIASIIAEAGYSPAEAENILRTEVAPVFHVNLQSVAGEWTGWTEEDVRKMVLDRLSKTAWWENIGWLRGIILNRFTGLVAEDWARVRKLL